MQSPLARAHIKRIEARKNTASGIVDVKTTDYTGYHDNSEAFILIRGIA